MPTVRSVNILWQDCINKGALLRLSRMHLVLPRNNTTTIYHQAGFPESLPSANREPSINIFCSLFAAPSSYRLLADDSQPLGLFEPGKLIYFSTSSVKFRPEQIFSLPAQTQGNPPIFKRPLE